MAELHLTGTSAGTILQANNSITSNQTFTFPDTGGELATAPTGGQVVGYQQGTWTAIGSAAGSGEFTMGRNNCLWTRIGNRVTLDLDLGYSSEQTSGEIGFVNLPYPSANIDDCIYQGIVGDASNISMNTQSGDGYTQPYFRMSGSSSIISLMSRLDAYAHEVVGTANTGSIATDSILRGSISYFTDNTDWIPQNGATLS